MTQLPSVGRDVHYVSRGSADGVFPPACRAAKVTEVGGDTSVDVPNVGLCVTNPDGHFFHPLSKNGGIAYDGGHAHTEDLAMCDTLFHEPGTWHWPARV